MSMEHSILFIDAYEQLRKYVVDSAPRAPTLNGLAVLMHKGVAAWMRATAVVVTTSPEPALRHGRFIDLPATVHLEVVELLTTMTLASSLEARA